MSCQKEQWKGCCCCNCRFHVADYYHCTTKPELRDELERLYGHLNPPQSDTLPGPIIKHIGCICGIQKGWVCLAPEFDGVHSDWDEHGMCEMHLLKDQPRKS